MYIGVTECHGWLCLQVTDSAGFERAINRAVAYLESQLNAINTDPYALNIVSYALTLARSSQASNAVRMLSALAITEGLKHFTLSCLSFLSSGLHHSHLVRLGWAGLREKIMRTV